MSIFLLTKIVQGPGGHGEPGQKYYAASDDGNGYVIGKPHPYFETYDEAMQFKKDNLSEYSNYEPLEFRKL